MVVSQSWFGAFSPVGQAADVLRRSRLVGALLLAVAATIVVAAAWAAFVISERQGIDAERSDSEHRLDLFASAAEAMVKRLEYVPPTIQLNREVQRLLHDPLDASRVREANDYLRRLNAYLGSISVYVLNDRGVVLASSNDRYPDDSRIGEDVSFRPYFLEALSGRVGRHFAIGINGNQPGYFVSHPVRDGARVVGVAAIKISLDPINDLWATLAAPAVLADTNQVVILSSQPQWRYTALAELPIERRVDLQLTRVYNGMRPPRFPLPVSLSFEDASQVVNASPASSDTTAVSAVQAGTLVLGRTIDGMDWRLLMFSSLLPVRQRALLNAAAAAVAACLVLLSMLFVAQRRRAAQQRMAARAMLERANAQLERKVDERTRDLTAANLRLREEVAERAQAERTLRSTHDELVQAAKMAMLGQIAAGITHELMQPLGAIRTLSGNTVEFMRRGELGEVPGNLGIIARLADQMGQIIQPLKTFARKSPPVPVAADAARAVSNALFLYHSRARKEGVDVVNLSVPGRAVAWCDPNRLEQVLINLIGNAIDAMADSALKRLTIRATTEAVGCEPHRGLRVRIDVMDTGIGLSKEVEAQLFDAFFTTKRSGAGLGLGLIISRDIAREFGGDIVPLPCADGGACFSLLLPAAAEDGRTAAQEVRDGQEREPEPLR